MTSALIISQDEAACESLFACLDRASFIGARVDRLGQAVYAAATGKFDIVFADTRLISLWGIEGIRFLKFIKQGQTEDSKIIMIIDSNSDGDIAAYEKFASAFLDRKITDETLEACLRDCKTSGETRSSRKETVHADHTNSR